MYVWGSGAARERVVRTTRSEERRKRLIEDSMLESWSCVDNKRRNARLTIACRRTAEVRKKGRCS